MIYDKYGAMEDIRKYGGEKESQEGREGKKEIFKKCHSLKNLKNRNTCDDI